MTYKIERLEKIFEREIGNLILTCKDDRLKFVKITKVKLTNDLSFATIYYTVIGSKEQIQATSLNLEESTGFIKKHLSGVLEIRKIPNLKFKYDESLEYGEKIENIIKGFKK